MNIDNNIHQEDNQNQYRNNQDVNNIYLYNNEEFTYILRYSKITISFLIIFFIKLFFFIYIYFFENYEKFVFQPELIIKYNQYYRFITRYFVNFGFGHLLIELFVINSMCILFENILGTLFTIILIFISLVLISLINLILIELVKYLSKFSNNKNYLEFEYEGGLTPLFFTLYSFYFSFNRNSNILFFVLFIFIVKARNSEYLWLLILIFFTPNNSIYGNISGIITAYILKCCKKYILPQMIWIKEIENKLYLYKLFPLYRYISEENPIMIKIINEFDINFALNELNTSNDLDNGQQMTELTLLSSENENNNHNNS